MKAVFVCMHGNAARELIQSAEMICGEQENVGYTFFDVGETPEDLAIKMEHEVAKLNVDEGILFLTDLKGGTPFNVLVRNLDKFMQAELLTGANIPMLLEALISRDLFSLTDLTNQVLETGKTGIYRYVAPKEFEDDDF
ncbi:PTS sugar transporter subunit IIA [Listeria aquatica]|uniref:PTS sugar transporter subunit IIA n=1 Tax=Listeria aquatica TaxID=1494960 RepID=A0A841ZNI9_9LIST|nr:PTS sugar transporter subunit IIA [Listeria aquatica]